MNIIYRCNLWITLLIVSCSFCFELVARNSVRQGRQKKLTYCSASITENVAKSNCQIDKLKTFVMAPPNSQNFDIVRVLLRSWSDETYNSLNISCASGFWLAAPVDGCVVSFDLKTITLATQRNCLFIQGKKVCPDQFYIIPKEGYIALNGNQYRGMINVVRSSGDVLIINCVDLEDYICSVLGTESWPGWPLEVNKVFAVVSRSYVMAMMQQQNKRNSFYHVRNTNIHQTYSGEHASDIIRKAVEQTQGVFLGYNNNPILAMFDSCCGGLIPAHIEDFDFSKVPYLARKYPCNHCKRCKIYQWHAEYNRFELEGLLKTIFPRISRVKNLHIKKADKAGIVQEVMLEPGGHIISGKQLYSLLKPLKSFCFSAKNRGNNFYFDGKGFGHHIGLCQWGAREMVRDGWSYKRILRFYYPGTRLACLARKREK